MTDGKSSFVRVDPGSGEARRWGGYSSIVYDLAVAGDRLLATTGLAMAGPAVWMGGESATGAAPWYRGGYYVPYTSGGRRQRRQQIGSAVRCPTRRSRSPR